MYIELKDPHHDVQLFTVLSLDMEKDAEFKNYMTFEISFQALSDLQFIENFLNSVEPYCFRIGNFYNLSLKQIMKNLFNDINTLDIKGTIIPISWEIKFDTYYIVKFRSRYYYE